MLAKIASGAADRAAGTDAGDERVDMVQLFDQFRSGTRVVDFWIGRVAELLRHEISRIVAHQLLGLADRSMHSARIGSQHQLRAIRRQQRTPLLAHRIGHRQDKLVTLDCTYQREPDSSIARGGFDDGIAGLDAAVLFRLLDHRQANAIFYTAARVIVLELGPYFGIISGRHAVKPHHRSMADQVERRTRHAYRHGAILAVTPGRLRTRKQHRAGSEFVNFAPLARSVTSESGSWKLVGQASLPIACPEEPCGDEWDDARASSPVPPRISHGILLPEKPSSLEA